MIKEIPAVALQCFVYDSSTGVITRVKKTHNQGRLGPCLRIDPLGYGVVSIEGVRTKAHRLAWFLHTGEQPPDVIDHVNRVRSDNRWTNLREATAALNLQNVMLSKRNTSGTKGVSYNSRTHRWESTIKVNNVRTVLGCFIEKEAAVSARKVAEAKMHAFNPQ